jgi:voltage-gated potassium channel
MKRRRWSRFFKKLTAKGLRETFHQIVKEEHEFFHTLHNTLDLTRRIKNGYEIFCYTLILFDLVFLSLSLIFVYKPSSSQMHNVGLIDLFVVLFLFVEFVFRLKGQENKRQYIERYWTDIIAIIPLYFIAFNLFGVTGTLELVIRVFAFVKILSLVRYFGKIQKEVLAFFEKTRVIYGLAIFLIVLATGAYLLFHVEHGVNPGLNGTDDALWYEITTVTGFGDGNVVPITGIGRLVGVTTMLTAILFSSLVTAAATSSLIEKFREEREQSLVKRKETVGDVLTKLDTLAEQMDKITSGIDDIKDIKAEIQRLKEHVGEDKR